MLKYEADKICHIVGVQEKRMIPPALSKLSFKWHSNCDIRSP